MKRVKIDGVTIVTPSENQNFTDKDARSVKRPKLGSFGKSKTLREFSENAIKKNLSLPSVHFLPEANANEDNYDIPERKLKNALWTLLLKIKRVITTKPSEQQNLI